MKNRQKIEDTIADSEKRTNILEYSQKTVCKNFSFNLEHNSKNEMIFFSFISTVLWGMLAHAYGFLNCNLSHDALNAFVANTVEETWKIELGRFFIPLYTTIFRGKVALPWLIGIEGLFWTAIAVVLVNSIFEVKSKILSILIAGIMTTNITFISQIATYIYEFDFNAFSLMLSVLSVYLWKKDYKWRSILFSAVCVLVSVGIYQAYFAVTVTLMIGKVIMDLFYGNEVKKVILHGLRGIGSVLLGCCMYFIVSKFIYAVTGIASQNRTDVFAFEENPILLYISLIQPALRCFFSKLIHSVYNRKFLVILLGILLLGIFISVLDLFYRKKYHFSRIFFICLLLLILPFAMISIFFLARGNGVHDLMVYAIWLSYIFLLIFTFWITENSQGLYFEKKVRWIKYLSCMLVVYLLIQNVEIANTAYIKKELEADATLSTMTRVVSMLEQRDDYDPKETKLAFIGKEDSVEDIEAFEKVSSITGLWGKRSIEQDTSVYYYNAYKAYFKYILQYPIQLCSDKEHWELTIDSRVKDMPTFPDNECIKMIDDILVVKMGN